MRALATGVPSGIGWVGEARQPRFGAAPARGVRFFTQRALIKDLSVFFCRSRRKFINPSARLAHRDGEAGALCLFGREKDHKRESGAAQEFVRFSFASAPDFHDSFRAKRELWTVRESRIVVPVRRHRFDPAKDAANHRKHKLSLAFGDQIFEDDNHLIIPSIREIDGEERFKVVGIVGEKLFTGVFVWRGDLPRFISVRRSNKGEEKSYNAAC